MSDTTNTASDAQAGEQFHAKVPPSEPLTTKGVSFSSCRYLPRLFLHVNGKNDTSWHVLLKQHQPGSSLNDPTPEGHLQAYPPGTAPEDRSFSPSGGADTVGEDAGKASASESLQGSTSAEVHQGYGHPGAGQTSAELHHDGQSGRKKQQAGLAKVGAASAE